ncbi:MAG: transglutaminase domain-containing protein [Bacteroidaceae bacterium]|nr:transglutaminase domain-containing protein [Bacteroidaceae bacterium]
MKLYYLALPLFASSSLFSACTSENDELYLALEKDVPMVDVPFGATPYFPEKDSSTKLSSASSQTAVYSLLKKTGAGIDTGFASFNITDAQYEEIKRFTDNLVGEETAHSKIYTTIFNWIVANIRYEWGDNDPYAVFTNRHAVCQGYANLLNVMLHTQDIPVINVNGWLDPLGGHAWNYVFYSNKWWVSDPTNNRRFAIDPVDAYSDLIPYSIDIDIFPSEEMVYSYTEKNFNLARVRKSDDMLVVPYSAGGVRITSFSPDSLLPANVREICLGANIETLGVEFMGLSHYAPNVERVYVDEKNPRLKEHLGVVYKKSNSELIYIPSAMPVVELLPVETMGKNYVVNVLGMEELIIAPGTKKLEAYAVENCPKLRRAYVPDDTEIDEKAFYSVHPDFEIVRGDLTSISQITM